MSNWHKFTLCSSDNSSGFEKFSFRKKIITWGDGGWMEQLGWLFVISITGSNLIRSSWPFVDLLVKGRSNYGLHFITSAFKNWKLVSNSLAWQEFASIQLLPLSFKKSLHQYYSVFKHAFKHGMYLGSKFRKWLCLKYRRNCRSW